MDKNIPILVIGGKGGSVSEGLLKALRLSNYKNLSILEHTSKSAHLYRVDKTYIIDETPNDACYLDKLLELCIQESISVLVPGSTWEAMAIASRINDFKDNSIIPLTNDYNVIKTCNDKWNTFQFLSSNNIETPLTIYPFNEKIEIEDYGLKYPIILKPRVGRGSQDVFNISNKKELKHLGQYLKSKNVDFILQEYVGKPSTEYTIGIISDKDRIVVDSIVLKRELGGGYTDMASLCDHLAIKEFCQGVAKKLNSLGPCNIQLRIDDKNIPKIFEINPRFSGSAPMRAIAGFNEPDMVIRSFVFNEKLSKPKIKENLQFFRVFQELYLETNNAICKANMKNYL